MKILFLKTFGIGNAVMALPAIKALSTLGEVSVLIGNLPDDRGALEVFNQARLEGMFKEIFVNSVPLDQKFDVAVLSIPYDGRWRNGIHFNADRILDGRTRPDPSTTGLSSWKRHEVEYQVDNARELGFTGNIPDCSFIPTAWPDSKKIYLGLGYKKDAARFWEVKHWGNENYARLIQLILQKYPDHTIITTGDQKDLFLNAFPIFRMASVGEKFKIINNPNIYKAFDIISSCGMYVGNDTGMMHVAASCGSQVIGMFFLENSITKSRPWCEDYLALDGFPDRSVITPEYVMDMIVEMKNGV